MYLAGCSEPRCFNGGTCRQALYFSDFVCECPEGFSGKRCEIGEWWVGGAREGQNPKSSQEGEEECGDGGRVGTGKVVQGSVRQSKRWAQWVPSWVPGWSLALPPVSWVNWPPRLPPLLRQLPQPARHTGLGVMPEQVRNPFGNLKERGGLTCEMSPVLF